MYPWGRAVLFDLMQPLWVISWECFARPSEDSYKISLWAVTDHQRRAERPLLSVGGLQSGTTGPGQNSTILFATICLHKELDLFFDSFIDGAQIHA